MRETRKLFYSGSSQPGLHPLSKALTLGFSNSYILNSGYQPYNRLTDSIILPIDLTALLTKHTKTKTYVTLSL